MTFWNWLTRKRDDRGWPGYIINGRIRTSTAALILAFFVISWLHNTYQPQPPAPVQETQVVPPGFVPDPDYTWVPRSQLEQPPRTVYRTVTPTPTTTTPTETPTPTETSPTETTPTTPTLPGELPTTTVIDPDGPGPAPATTLTLTPTPTPLPPGVTPQTIVPNRSGVPMTPPTSVAPEPTLPIPAP